MLHSFKNFYIVTLGYTLKIQKYKNTKIQKYKNMISDRHTTHKLSLIKTFIIGGFYQVSY